ncbi:hypothetical protein F4802DRAFT_612414 [Xylaria palmicola]|nr:hypothetical protein F4802DRAFT_612414 [Xylaria palmicola]
MNTTNGMMAGTHAHHSQAGAAQDGAPGLYPIYPHGTADPTAADDSTTHGNAAPQGGPGARGGRRQAGSQGRAKRARAHGHNDDPEDGDNDTDNSRPAKKNARKRGKMTSSPAPEVHPVEIHRKKTSLRERLIRGEYEPQATGMRAHNLKKGELCNPSRLSAEAETAANARAAADAPLPIDPRLDSIMSAYPQPANNNVFVSNSTIAGNNNNNASKSTPIRQLYFSQIFINTLRHNIGSWEDRGEKHSEGLVFVVLRLVDGDAADVRVFASLRAATAECLHLVVSQHPEAFAPDDIVLGRQGEDSQRVTALIHEIAGSFDDYEDTEDEELLDLDDADEPTYMFQGSYHFSSFGLSMEARQPDGAVAKVSVHLKDVRRLVGQ